jgi:nucleoside-diphosphate-sugar epimerase
MTTKVFITSGTGFIGKEVARAYKKKGFEVTALTRSPESAKEAQQEGFQVHNGDITKPETYQNILKNYDIVVHTAATNDERYAESDQSVVETVLKELKDTNKTFIYTSGVWVLGNTGNTPTEETAEGKPIALVAWRREVEKKVQEAAKQQIKTVVIRPGIVYGNNEGVVAHLLEDARKNGEARYFGTGENRWSPIHVEDLADLYLLATEKAQAGTLFHATEEKPVTTEELAREIANIAGVPNKTKALTSEEAQKRLGPWAEGLALDQYVVSNKARKELGWAPRRNLVEELKKEQKTLAGAR